MRAFLLIALIALAALSQFGGGGGVLPIVPSGPKTAIIVYETEDTSVDLASLFTSLRHGPIAERIAKDGHQLLIMDKDTKDERKQPLPLLARFAPYSTIPELIIADKAGQTLVKRYPLPASPNAVAELIK